jgi:hypothetical protein
VIAMAGNGLAGTGSASTAPESTEDALAMLHASLGYLTAADWRELGGYAQGRALRSLGAAHGKWSAAHAAALLAFDSSGGFAADGHPTARTWLQHQTRITRAAARELGQSMCRLAAHPLLRDAQAAGEISESWIRQLALWTDRLPADEIDKADEILLDAARAGLDLRSDIAKLAEAIVETVRGQRPDSDPEDDGFADRGVRMGTTIGGAGKLAGDLSAPCAALLEQVFATFGKPAGAGDLRNPGQRNHDALETALRLSLGVPGIPDSGGLLCFPGGGPGPRCPAPRLSSRWPTCCGWMARLRSRMPGWPPRQASQAGSSAPPRRQPPAPRS